MIGTLTFLIICLILIIYGLQKPIKEFNKAEIKVDEISLSTLRRKPQASFNFNKYVNVKAVKIVAEDRIFFVDKRFDDFWKEVLQKVKVGSQLTIYYHKEEGNQIVVKLEGGSGVILSDEYMNKKGIQFSWGILVLILLNIILLMSLIFKRRRINNPLK